MSVHPNQILLPYNEKAKYLIKEGDVLLFRGTGWLSFFISQSRHGLHSHVAMASWHNAILECVEFREFKGGRTVNLGSQVDKNPGRIDVFRPKYKFPVLYGAQNDVPEYVMQKYDGLAATRMMRKMTGLPYGWGRIWQLAKYHMPYIRWRIKPEFNDKATNDDVYPICSTAVATSIRIGGYNGLVDLRPLKPDSNMEPPDIASSPVLDYLFTLERD